MASKMPSEATINQAVTSLQERETPYSFAEIRELLKTDDNMTNEVIGQLFKEKRIYSFRMNGVPFFTANKKAA